jgi:RecJ-like exonuclease
MNGLVHLALVGATGDMQADDFIGLNKELLDYGINQGFLSVVKGLKVFGRVSKPLHEALANSFELLIPGITGNESACIEFLAELNIDLKNEDGSWKTLALLSEAEKKKLITNIIIRRLAHKLDSKVLSKIVVVNNKKGLLTDLKEWSVLLNACGRMGVHSLGVLLCMGYEGYALPLIEKVMKEYKVLLSKALNLVKNDDSLTSFSGDLLILKGGSKIKDTIIGTIGGILLRDSEYSVNSYIGFADRDAANVKVSCRTKTSINIGMVLKNVCEQLDCIGGGHKLAGGALILKSKEDEFLKVFKEELGKHL